MYLKQGSIRDVWADSGGALLRKHPQLGLLLFGPRGVAFGGFWRGWSALGERKGWGGRGRERAAEEFRTNALERGPTMPKCCTGPFFFFLGSFSPLWRGRR
jgi:hypothetical protein